MEIVRKGCTRIVLLIGGFAIKIPNFTSSHRLFLKGCFHNYSEREIYKFLKNTNLTENPISYLTPSLFCSWFGIIQIQKRCLVLKRNLTDKECKFFKGICNSDDKKENFGIYKGRLVCLDYPDHI